jgi:radical SAM superfamily enzyme YgiQ (UPF0313 family)
LGKGKYVRFRTPPNVVDEIKEGLKKYKWIKYVNLQDDAFCLDKEYVRSFCKIFKDEINLPFYANTRANLVTEEICESLSKGGCKHVAIGIESGNKEIREKILKRFMTNEQIINAIKLCHKHGINVGTYNIIGLPNETISNVLETLKLNVISGADSMHVSIFQPYPNSELYDYCLANNLVDDSEVSTFFGNYLIDQKSISKEEVKFAYKYFYIYMKLYKSIGKVKVFENLLDKMFVLKKTHKAQMVAYPLMFFMTHPVLATYRLMMKISPKMTRKIKDKVYKK